MVDPNVRMTCGLEISRTEVKIFPTISWVFFGLLTGPTQTFFRSISKLQFEKTVIANHENTITLVMRVLDLFSIADFYFSPQKKICRNP
eukprot:g22845.t1